MRLLIINRIITPKDCLIHFLREFLIYIMKEIKLTQEKVALVDDGEFESLNQFRWYAHKDRNTFYAVRNIRVGGKQKSILMHWEVMGGKWIDHIDHNGLNNMRSNLRFCTNKENLMNQRKKQNTSSVYKGVSFHKHSGKWEVQIMINGKNIYLGLFSSETDAGRAYDKKAIELCGEFANLNNIN